MAAIEHGLLERKAVKEWVNWHFNGQDLEDCTHYSLLQVLNYLGKDEWEFAGTLDQNQYILKRK